MSPYSSIRQFPKDWGEKARCPVCKNRSMRVYQFDSACDQMHCSICGVSFEIEEKGGHLFFTETPRDLEAVLKHRWVSRQELAQALDKMEVVASDQHVALKPKTNLPKANPLRAEAVRRARKLVELGNSPEIIRKSLSESMQLKDFAIEEIIKDATMVHKLKKRQQNRKYFIFFAMILVFMVAAFIVLAQYL